MKKTVCLFITSFALVACFDVKDIFSKEFFSKPLFSKGQQQFSLELAQEAMVKSDFFKKFDLKFCEPLSSKKKLNFWLEDISALKVAQLEHLRLIEAKVMPIRFGLKSKKRSCVKIECALFLTDILLSRANWDKNVLQFTKSYDQMDSDLARYVQDVKNDLYVPKCEETSSCLDLKFYDHTCNMISRDNKSDTAKFLDSPIFDFLKKFRHTLHNVSMQ